MNPPASNRLPKRLYSLAEAASYLGRSIWSVRRLIWNGELPQVFYQLGQFERHVREGLLLWIR